MTMKEGVLKFGANAIDIKDDLCETLMKGGMDFPSASKASSIIAKSNLGEIFDKVIGKDADNGAAGITHGLNEAGQGRRSLDS